MPKIQNYASTAAIHPEDFGELSLVRDSILSENKALRELIVEIKLQCEVLRERLPAKVSYH